MTHPSPLFSVVVPTYRRTGRLAEALESVRRQTHADFECVVVDDAGPEQVVVPDDPRFRLVRREVNGGAAAARTSGIEAARGGWVCFLDDDDLYLPHRLEVVVPHLDRDVTVVVGRAEIRGDADGETIPWPQRDLQGDVADEILDGPIPHLGTVTVRREHAEPFASLPASEDVEWWLRVARLAPVLTLHDVAYLKRQHDEPRLTSRVGPRVEARRAILEQHRDYFADHPRAAAFQWHKLATLLEAAGDERGAAKAHLRSFRASPRVASARGVARAASAIVRRRSR